MSRFKTFFLIHIAAWLMFMAFPLVFLNSHGQLGDSKYFFQSPDYWLFGLTFIFLFYSNAYYLVPRFLLNRRYLLYVGAVLILLTGTYLIRPFDRLLHVEERIPGRWPQDSHPPFGQPGHQRKSSGEPPPRGKHGPPAGHERPQQKQPVDITSFFLFLMIMAGSAFITVIQQWRVTEQRAVQAEADKANAELSFLKAQINPHFLFNTLNNIYTLALIKDDHAADSIMKLSRIMHYVTDEVTADFVPLEREIDCIADYIELQRLRIGDQTIIDFNVQGHTDGKLIPPLVLMTFVENVFKYGISKQERSVIEIKIMAHETDLSFYCKNRIFGLSSSDQQQTGIGIKNTRQRLKHLYPGKYLLNISDERGEYIVQLTLHS